MKRLMVLSFAGLMLASCSIYSLKPNSSSENKSSIEESTSGTSSTNSSAGGGSKTSSSTTNPESSGTADKGSVAKTSLNQSISDYVGNNAYEISSCPSTGEAKLLIIPIWFTDSSSYISTSQKSAVRDDIESAYLGSEEETGWQSVKTYYETLSKGKLSLNATVSDWYAPGKSSSYYYSDGDRTTSLVKEASDNFFSKNTSEKRSDYDCDGDGYLDGVMLIYGSPDYSALNNSKASNMWAYCYWRQDSSVKNTSNPGANAFFWASYDFMYSSGNDAKSHAGSKYGSGDTSNVSIDSHTFIHEMGHVFGLEDYYDYSSNNYVPAGGFSMQDHNIGCHDPYSAMVLGWVDPYIPTETCEIELKPFQCSNDAILLSPSWNSFDSPFDEYLLLEFYTPTGLNQLDVDYGYSGYPTGPDKSGIRLWHVDSRLAYLTASQIRSGITDFTASQLTSNAKMSNAGVTLAMSNTYYDKTGDSDGYISVLGSSYADYNLLQLIRNDTDYDYKPEYMLSESELFGNGSSFSMSTFKKQFKNSGKLNANGNLGWSFTVSINGTGEDATAKISLTKSN